MSYGNCQGCGSPLKLTPAGVSKNTGKNYEAFIGCSNFKNCTYRPPKDTLPKAPQSPVGQATPKNAESAQQIINELIRLNLTMNTVVQLLEAIAKNTGVEAEPGYDPKF